MPHDYVRSQRKYRDANGNYVSRRELKTHIDKLTGRVTTETKRIAERYEAGEITVAEFGLEMRELLKSAHIVAASVGRGGRELMEARDWARVGAKIKWQYGYLDKFTRKLARGTVTNPANRARAYVNSVYISFARTFQEAQTEPLTPTGDQTKDENILVRLITNSEEGCAECAADEAEGWMQPEDMGELGTRICGDWCKCTLEFSDEVTA